MASQGGGGLEVGSEIQALWAGYGSIREARWQGAAVVCKQIQPPPSDGTVGHGRKVRSYEVEAAFYRSTLPQRLCVPSCHRAPKEEDEAPLLNCPPPRRAAGAHVAVASGPRPPSPSEIVLEDLRPTHPALGVKKKKEENRADAAAATTKASLDWLARAHAATWADGSLVEVVGLWPDGTFWRLDTRPDEFEAIAGSALSRAARAIDLRLRGYKDWHPRGAIPGGGLHASARHWALLHGDFKSTNLFYDDAMTSCAACDFQYCGPGAVVKDLAYHLVGSVHEDFLDGGQDKALVAYYHARLLLEAGPAIDFPFEACWAQYRLAVADYTRWMEGWGSWGAARYAAQVTEDLLKDLRVDATTDEGDVLDRVWKFAPP